MELTGKFVPLGALILTLNSLTVSAHEFWLEPDRFSAPVNSDVGFDIRIGQNFNGRAYPYIERETAAFFVKTEHESRDIKAMNGDKPAVSLRLEDPALWVAYESTDFSIRFNNSQKFIDYVNTEGLGWVADWYGDKGLDPQGATETYYRHAKALVWNSTDSVEWLSEPLGMRIELVPQPGFIDCKTAPAFRVLYQGKPLENHLVRRFTKGVEQIDEALSDAQGLVQFSAARGEFLLNVVHIKDSTHPRALGQDWVSDWGSLTYACNN